MLGIPRFRLGFEPRGLEGQRAEIPELAMRPRLVVVAPEPAQPDTRLGMGHAAMQTDQQRWIMLRCREMSMADIWTWTTICPIPASE